MRMESMESRTPSPDPRSTLNSMVSSDREAGIMGCPWVVAAIRGMIFYP